MMLFNIMLFVIFLILLILISMSLISYTKNYVRNSLKDSLYLSYKFSI